MTLLSAPRLEAPLVLTADGLLVPVGFADRSRATSEIERLSTGLLHADDFSSDTRTDYTFSYSNGGSVSIVSEWMRFDPPDNHAIIAQVDGITAGKCFAQMTQRYPNGVTASYSGLVLRATGWGSFPNTLITDGFQVWMNTFDDQFALRLIVASVASGANVTETGWAASTPYVTQLYVADGLQESWLELNDRKVGATDTDHDGENTRGIGFWGQRYAVGEPSIEIDDVLFCADRLIACSGMSSGEQLKVYAAGDVEIHAATESGGTASIDVSKYTDTGSPIIPLAGWSYVTVEDGDDVELARYDAAAIYPGDIFEAS